MDSRLLAYYNRELAYLRELGGEFSRQYPRVAAELGMREDGTTDPYVERLLEGFSFLTARIHMKMDAEFPRFSERLLDIIYPNYLAPLPSMTIVEMQPSLREGNLANGYTLPAGTSLRAHLADGASTACEFRTAHDVALWPLRVTDARLGADLGRLSAAGLPLPAGVRGALHLQLEAGGVNSLGELPIERLTFYIDATDGIALPLLELVMSHGIAVACQSESDSGRAQLIGMPGAIRQEGLDAAQALLPNQDNSFNGYRLLHEYFAYPSRFLFFSIGPLRDALRNMTGTRFTLSILLDQATPDLERGVGAKNFRLFCTPAINLFPKRTDRLPLSTQKFEHHVVVDRTKPLDYEVFSIEGVTGHQQSDGQNIEFHPLYGTSSGAEGDHGRYFSVRREPRLLAARGYAPGQHHAYAGNEMFISLVDQHDAPHADGLHHVSVSALCTNRDLATTIPRHHASDFSLRVSAPVTATRIVQGPTPPRPAIAEGETTWRLISHLALNYLTLTDIDSSRGAAALRELLQLYAGAAQPALLKQIDGIRSSRIEAVYRQLPHPGPIVFGRGVRVSLLLDELAFAGSSTYLFGAVLEQFFARHVSLNSFCELTVSTLQHGEIMKWQPRIGLRPTA